MNTFKGLNLSDYADEFQVATYDAADDKLRLYSDRIPAELFKVLTEVGFQRAYKQGCFFAVWTPLREGIALALCGDIEDESSTPQERAADKAARLEQYSANASKRSEDARARVDGIASQIPMGQPILVGHHSERRARRDQDRIYNGMRRSVDEWRKAERWAQYAASVTAHAERRERPDVILRRIKKLEADKRKHEREKTPTDLDWSRMRIIKDLFGYGMFDEYTLTAEQSEQVEARLRAGLDANIERCDRWIEHIDLRLVYERQLYDNAAGPKPTDLASQLVIGSFVRARGYGWVGPVLRINKGRDGLVSSVSVKSQWSWNIVIELSNILEVKNDEAIKTGG